MNFDLATAIDERQQRLLDLRQRERPGSLTGAAGGNKRRSFPSNVSIFRLIHEDGPPVTGTSVNPKRVSPKHPAPSVVQKSHSGDDTERRSRLTYPTSDTGTPMAPAQRSIASRGSGRRAYRAPHRLHPPDNGTPTALWNTD